MFEMYDLWQVLWIGDHEHQIFKFQKLFKQVLTYMRPEVYNDNGMETLKFKCYWTQIQKTKDEILLQDVAVCRRQMSLNYDV